MAPKQQKVTKKAPAKKEETTAVDAAAAPPAAKKKRITLAPEGIVMAEEAAAKKAARKEAKAPAKKTKAEAVEELKKKAEVAKKGGEKKKKIVIEGESDNESDVSIDLEFSDDEDGNVKIPKKAGGKKGAKKGEEKKKESHVVLQLRHLPKEFEEPQLFRFFSQFNANVTAAFCVRSKRSHQSLGTAFVQFDKPKVIPTVIDECHGMLLGGRTVRARRVRINRALPSKKAVQARMNRAHTIEARGIKLNRFDLGKKQQAATAEDVKKAVGYLIKYSRTEAAQNKRLAELGIDYSFDGFKSQLAKVDKTHFVAKEKKAAAEETA